ncbi:MAG: hypothetical protein C0602_11475 [Denitrovibrio sp.]|nr:MAG: hypothetical protein C0602_11475 [Denitrovibrio sp.]
MSQFSEEDIKQINDKEHEKYQDEYKRFIDAYDNGICYLCGKPFKTISTNNPCLHWLLRQCKFRAKDFHKIYKKYNYHQIVSFLRWIANTECFQRNINDLQEEKRDNMLIESTIKWKNIEWTFSCTHSDYAGHEGTQASFPHYHFQMKIDGQIFIKFNSHHIRFSDEDLFNISITQDDSIPASYSLGGAGGSGMQDALSLDPDEIIDSSIASDGSEGTYHFSTFIQANSPEGISGDVIQDMIDESKRTGKTIASLADKYIGDLGTTKTIIAAADSVPEIAERKGRSKK